MNLFAAQTALHQSRSSGRNHRIIFQCTKLSSFIFTIFVHKLNISRTKKALRLQKQPTLLLSIRNMPGCNAGHIKNCNLKLQPNQWQSKDYLITGKSDVTSAFCPRLRRKWSINTIAIIASAMGVARIPTQGS